MTAFGLRLQGYNWSGKTFRQVYFESGIIDISKENLGTSKQGNMADSIQLKAGRNVCEAVIQRYFSETKKEILLKTCQCW